MIAALLLLLDLAAGLRDQTRELLLAHRLVRRARVVELDDVTVPQHGAQEHHEDIGDEPRLVAVGVQRRRAFGFARDHRERAGLHTVVLLVLRVLPVHPAQRVIGFEFAHGHGFSP